MNTLTIDNFRSIRQAEMPLDGLTFVHGDNGAGKSSIAGAIGTVLVGRNRWTDRKGAGMGRQVGHAGDEAVVALDVRGKRVSRTIKQDGGSSVKVAGFAGSPTVQMKALLTKLGVTVDTLAVACDTQALLEATPKEQADIIFGALAAKIERQDVLDHFVKAGLTVEQAELVLAEAETGVSWPLSADGIEALYKNIYTARTEAKKEQDAAAMEARPATELVLVKPEQLDGWRAGLAQLEQQMTGLRARQAKAEADARARAIVADDQGVDMDALAGRIKKGQAKVAQLAGQEEIARKAVQDARAAVDALPKPAPERRQAEQTPKTDWHAVADLAAEHDERIGRFEREIQAICKPLTVISEKLRALAVRNGVQLFADKFAAERAAHQAKVEIEQKRKAAQQALAEAESGLAEIGRRHADARRLLHELEQKLAADQERAEILAKLDDQEGEDPQALAAELDELEATASKGRTRIAQAEAGERFRAVKERAEQKLDRIGRRVQVLEQAVEALRPATRTAMIEQKTGGVLTRLGQAFARLTRKQYQLVVNLAPFEVLVQRQDDPKAISLGELSASEQFRVAVLLQDAVASIGHAPILVVDGADILMSEEFAALVRYLETRVEHYQAIVLTASMFEQDERYQAVGDRWKRVLVDSGQAFALDRAA